MAAALEKAWSCPPVAEGQDCLRLAGGGGGGGRIQGAGGGPTPTDKVSVKRSFDGMGARAVRVLFQLGVARAAWIQNPQQCHVVSCRCPRCLHLKMRKKEIKKKEIRKGRDKEEIDKKGKKKKGKKKEEKNDRKEQWS